MTYRGRVKGGVVVLERGAKLREGELVTVFPRVGRARALAKSKTTRATPGANHSRKPTGLAKLLLKHAGVIKDLPPDLSANLDHYLYGHPKRNSKGDEE